VLEVGLRFGLCKMLSKASAVTLVVVTLAYSYEYEYEFRVQVSVYGSYKLHPYE